MRPMVKVTARRRQGFTHDVEIQGGHHLVIDEPEAVSVGGDDGERELFADAQARLLADGPALHAMLAITGGSAWEAGPETILGAPYQSWLFDLVAGPAPAKRSKFPTRQTIYSTAPFIEGPARPGLPFILLPYWNPTPPVIFAHRGSARYDRHCAY